MFLLAPGIICFVRMIFIVLFFRFDSPLFLYAKIKLLKEKSRNGVLDYETTEQINILKKEANRVLSLFNENTHNIYLEIKLIEENVNIGYSKGESSVCDQIKTNIFSKDRVYSFLTTTMYISYVFLAGNVFIDIYSTEVFTKFENKEYADKVN